MAKKEILKPFDLEKAKAGAKLRTKDGYDARIVCYDRYGNSPILALVKQEISNEEVCRFYKKMGKWRIWKVSHLICVLSRKPKFLIDGATRTKK